MIHFIKSFFPLAESPTTDDAGGTTTSYLEKDATADALTSDIGRYRICIHKYIETKTFMDSSLSST